MPSRAQRIRSRIQSTIGGVMTEEVGAITGDLEVETALAGRHLDVKVAYAGACDWYRVRGAPLIVTTGADLQHLHRLVTERLTTPRSVRGGNEPPVDLAGLLG